MASTSDQPTTMEQLLRKLQRDVTMLQRRRIGDGVNIDGQCEYGGGAGGDGGYYGGGTDFPNPDFPDSSYPPYLDDWLNDWFTDNPGSGGGGTTYTGGANIDVDGSVIHFEVVFEEPVTPRIGMFWFDETA